MAEVNPIPDSYPRITPYLCVDGAAAAIDFYTAVFDATERMRMGGDPATRPTRWATPSSRSATA